MHIDVLGSSGTYAAPLGACSGYLLRHDGFALWMDAGSGTLARYQQYLRLEELDGLFLSHMHPDHMVDVYTLFYALWFHPDQPRGIPLLAPAGSMDFIGRLLSDGGREDFTKVFDVREISPGGEAHIGPLRLRFFDSVHSAPNLTIRAEADGEVACYSGDTGANSHLAEAARDAGLFLCEATWQRATEVGFDPIHLRAHEAGAAARESGAGKLVLTHIWPWLDAAVSIREASEIYGGPVDVARPGEGIEVA